MIIYMLNIAYPKLHELHILLFMHKYNYDKKYPPHPIPQLL